MYYAKDSIFYFSHNVVENLIPQVVKSQNCLGKDKALFHSAWLIFFPQGPIKKEVNDWHELLQLVLQQQIKALIKLGANPQLKVSLAMCQTILTFLAWVNDSVV